MILYIASSTAYDAPTTDFPPTLSGQDRSIPTGTSCALVLAVPPGNKEPAKALFTEMLASIPQMNRSLPQIPDGLPRHPSAEDLDAAQQLISSAQAGREHLADRHRDKNVRTLEMDSVHGANYPNNVVNGSTTSWPEASHNDTAGEKTSPKAQKDTSFLGHSCRFVPSELHFDFLTNRGCLLAIVGRQVRPYGADRLQVP